MFQYFGFKDAIMAIWKKKIKILSIVFILSILSTVIFSLLPIPQESADLGGGVKQSEEETIVLEKRGINFYIEYTGKDSELSGKVITDILIESLETEECKRYVYDYALQHMPAEEIVTRLHSEFSESSIRTDFFPQYLVYTRDESGIGVCIKCIPGMD